MRPTAWRGLERPGDLDIAFGGDAADLTTRVLAACGPEGALGEEGAWGLTLAGRIGGLAAVLGSTAEADALALALRCPAAACGEAYEVEVPLAAIEARAAEAEREPTVALPVADGRALRLRRPTGEDVRRWRARHYPTSEEAERAVLESLLPAGEPAPDLDGEGLRSALAAGMEEADPLPAFRLATRCPACGDEASHAVDLERALLARLEAHQRGTIRDVHRLAARYGWSEADVLALPAWRRRAYLGLIDAEASP